ncbi:MAG: glutamate--cysteine ligase [Desulforhopalus sp.]|jgi:glutamate--cysteine ligase
MNSVLQQQLTQLENDGTFEQLRGVMHGIEKEGLRIVESSGALALTPHPSLLGSPLTNGSITTDFSESLLELITPVFSTPDEAIHFLINLHQFTYTHLNNELIWAGSMPCNIPDASLIPIAEFGSSNIGKMKHVYRLGLQHRYGNMMQSIAGIHYNFSLPDSFWKSLQIQKKNTDDLQSFRSSSYFTLIRNFRRHSWLLLYLFGASPALSRSFMAGKAHNLLSLHKETLFLPYATSLRMSDLGYTTDAQASLKICFNQLDTYIKSLFEAISTPYPAYEKIGVKVGGGYRQLASTILQIDNEYYSDIRPKRVTQGDETSLQALGRRGVEYIEVRNTDINPFLPAGIDLQQALFLDVFLISCLLMGDDILSPTECHKANENLQKVTTRGREPGLKLLSLEGEKDLKTTGSELINDFEATAAMLDQLHNTTAYSSSVTSQLQKLNDPSLTPSSRVLASLHDSGLDYADWVLKKSKEHKATLGGLDADEQIFKHLSRQAEDSIRKQKEIESSDTMGFDNYVKTYRTGKQEDNANTLS